MSKGRGGYVLYWPEYSTWDDNAVSTVKRNRVTFMRFVSSIIPRAFELICFTILRYLTKLADQVVSLMSKEHSDAIVWTDEQSDKAATDKKKSAAHNRLYTFAVQKTKEQEENVTMHNGFKVYIVVYWWRAGFGSSRFYRRPLCLCLASSTQRQKKPIWLPESSQEKRDKLLCQALMFLKASLSRTFAELPQRCRSQRNSSSSNTLNSKNRR